MTKRFKQGLSWAIGFGLLVLGIFLILSRREISQENPPVAFSDWPPQQQASGALPANPVVLNGRTVSADEPPPIVRGPNNRLFFPEAEIVERTVEPKKIFMEPVMIARSGITGTLTMDQHTASAMEAAHNPKAIERFVQSDAQSLQLPLAAGHDITINVNKAISRGGRTRTLTGKVAGDPLSDVLLVFHDGAVSGSVAFQDLPVCDGGQRGCGDS